MTEPTQMRGGLVALDSRLGRLPHYDDRSRSHTIRELLPAKTTRAATIEPRALPGKYWTPGPTLDQDREGQCVSEGCSDRHNGSPLRRRPVVTDFQERRAFYHAAQHRDPFDGCTFGLSCPISPSGAAANGTTSLAGMQEGVSRGWWGSYRWVGAGSGTLEADIIDTLRGVGGILFGIPWHQSMYSTQPDGLVTVSGPEVGGHFIHAFEWIPRLRLPRSFVGTKPAVAWHNSWGSDYGVRRRWRSGVGYILLDDLLGLVDGYRGEGAVPLP